MVAFSAWNAIGAADALVAVTSSSAMTTAGRIEVRLMDPYVAYR